MSVVEATQTVVFCYSSPSKLKQAVMRSTFNPFRAALCLSSTLPTIKIEKLMDHYGSNVADKVF